MEGATFDRLLRKMTEQSTRRGALAALLGGALFLNGQGDLEATRRGRRRKNRKRRQRRRKHASYPLPLRVRVKNPGPATLDVQYVSLQNSGPLGITPFVCRNPQVRQMPAGDDVVFDTQGGQSGFVMVNLKYVIEFMIPDPIPNYPNQPYLPPPYITAAANGVSFSPRKYCPNRGTRALNDTQIPAGGTFKFKIYDEEFTVVRERDSRAIAEYTLTLPATL